MNCDQVFDILTQGPFPTGEPIDDRVERHISCCYECRQMAEALRPAVDLFHESIAEMDQMRLPEYRGQAQSSVIVTLPEVVKTSIEGPYSHQRSEFSSRQRSKAAFWLLGTGVLATTLAVITLIGVSVGASFTPKSESSRVSSSRQTPNERRVDQLAGIALAQLSQECFSSDGAIISATTPASSHAATKKVHCCTLCHNAANPNRPRIDSIAILEKSCGGCHAP